MRLFLTETFYTLTAALVVFSALELIREGFVSAFVNINWVLLVWLLFGIVLIITYPRNNAEGK